MNSIRFYLLLYWHVAQLVERYSDKVKATGAEPVLPTSEISSASRTFDC